LLTSVALVAAGAGIFAGSAAAKWGLEVDRPPAGLRAGDPWRLEIRAVGTHFPRLHWLPIVRIRHVASGRSYIQRARPLPGRPRTYEITITFPEAGRWRYVIRHLGAVFKYRPVVIEERRPSVRNSDGRTASLGTGPGGNGPGALTIVAGLGAASLLFATALAWRRKARQVSG
jgi:hypothetical protein